MEHYAIAFLGLGNLRADGYLETTYRDPQANREIQAYCAPHYLALANRLETISILATKEAWEDQEERLREVLSSCTPACVPEWREIPWGKNDDEMWRIFDVVVQQIESAPGPVLLDITHGFRHSPLIAALAAQYTEGLRAGKVARMTYAAVDMRTPLKYAPVLDLKPHVDLYAWNVGAALFGSTGRSEVFGKLLRTIGRDLGRRTRGEQVAPALNKLGGAMESLSNDLMTLRVETVRKNSAKALVRAATAAGTEEEVGRLAPALLRTLPRLEAVATPLDEVGHLEMMRWYVDHGHAALALGLGVEMLTTLACTRLGLSASDQLDHGQRSKAAAFAYHARRKGLARVRRFDGLMAQIGDALSQFKDSRNDVMHAQQRKQSLKASKVLERATKLLERLEALEPRVRDAGSLAPPESNPCILYNATLHDQSELVDEFTAQGASFAPGPGAGGFHVPVDWERHQIDRKAAEVVATAIAAGATGLLVGGISSATTLMYDHAGRVGLGVFEVATERHRTADGHFAFRSQRLREIRATAPWIAWTTGVSTHT